MIMQFPNVILCGYPAGAGVHSHPSMGGQPARPHSHHQGHPGVQPRQGQLAGAEPTGRDADVWPSRAAPV